MGIPTNVVLCTKDVYFKILYQHQKSQGFPKHPWLTSLALKKTSIFSPHHGSIFIKLSLFTTSKACISLARLNLYKKSFQIFRWGWSVKGHSGGPLSEFSAKLSKILELVKINWIGLVLIWDVFQWTRGFDIGFTILMNTHLW